MLRFSRDKVVGSLSGIRHSGPRRSDARSFIPSVRAFLGSGTISSIDYRLLLNAFIYSQGRLLTQANDLCEAVERERGSFEGLSRSCRGENHRYVEEVEREGFTVLSNVLDQESVVECRERLAAVECRTVSDRQEAAGRLAKPDMANPIAEKYTVPLETLARDPLVVRLVQDTRLQDIAAGYLGVPPILDTVSAWFSFPSNAASSQAGQIFHFDLERVKWLKCFVFLTDTSIDNGAHVFVPGTHKDGGIPRSILNRGYSRHSDERVADLLSREPVLIEAKAGDVLIEDTRGLHKGLRVRSGYRAVVELQFASCLYGGRSSWQEFLREEVHGQSSQ